MCVDNYMHFIHIFANSLKIYRAAFHQQLIHIRKLKNVHIIKATKFRFGI